MERRGWKFLSGLPLHKAAGHKEDGGKEEFVNLFHILLTGITIICTETKKL